MKKLILIFIIISHTHLLRAQEIPVSSEQQLENQAESEQAETEDDNWLQDLEQFRKHPIDINTADAGELKQLRVLSGLQIANLIRYRNLLGKLVSLYEMQAIPAWDIPTIKKILPFITISPAITTREDWHKKFSQGEHSLLLRVAQVLERARGFDKALTGTRYLGSPQRILFRYRYAYKNLLQFGMLGEKDAGERFLKGAQQKGFDHYTFHLFARRIGIVQSLALGDFTVQMGQGLIHWQGLAFKKSVEVMGIKRQSPVLRPYGSAGEFYFHRGAGITIRKGKMESTAFVSLRKLDANVIADTMDGDRLISSFLPSGYHRTTHEVTDRNTVTQTAFGFNLSYVANRLQAGLNGVYYRFSLPLQKSDEPYNGYAISGTSWYNISMDYSYTWKNLHFFGEMAADMDFNKAFVNGLLISVDTRVDLTLLHRHLSPAYQALYGNAFTENSNPTNERGLYAGITMRPAAGWRIDAYGDVFKFPWLKYGVDAPSRGTDYMVQITYTPDKLAEIYTRYRSEEKQANQPGNTAVTSPLVYLPRQSWRTQVNYKVSTAVTVRVRSELLWYAKEGDNEENGFLLFTDILYKPLLKPWSAGIRLQYFKTDGYNSRIYAYENDVLYNYTVPAFFDGGYRYYLNLEYDLGKKIRLWLRWARTYYPGMGSLGSGLDEIKGPGKTELRFQARLIF